MIVCVWGSLCLNTKEPIEVKTRRERAFGGQAGEGVLERAEGRGEPRVGRCPPTPHLVRIAGWMTPRPARGAEMWPAAAPGSIRSPAARSNGSVRPKRGR